MSEIAEKDFRWYVAHTYSGYENKVKDTLLSMIGNNEELREDICEVTIPEEEVIEIKNGKRRTVMRKLLPGYVFVKMVMNEATWYKVRNTRGVTGFVGPDSKKPTPLTEEEYEALCNMRDPAELEISVGDSVRILTPGVLKDMDITATVVAIDRNAMKVTIQYKFMGDQTLELPLDEVVKRNVEVIEQ